MQLYCGFCSTAHRESSYLQQIVSRIYKLDIYSDFSPHVFTMEWNVKPCILHHGGLSLFGIRGSLFTPDNQIEFDPDQNFYKEQTLFHGYSWSYYLEDSFYDKSHSFACDLSQCFALCHINTRSIGANLSHFGNYLQLLSINFPVITIIEIWFDDVTCDLYSVSGYKFIEQHRSDRNICIWSYELLKTK